MTSRAFDIVVVGELNPDLILSGDVIPQFGQAEQFIDSAVFTTGSSSAIFACGAARLGLRVAFIGKAGPDMFGEFMVKVLRERGVDTGGVILDPAEQTGLTVILTDGEDRTSLVYRGAIPHLRFEDIDPAALASARHLHYASYFIQDGMRPRLPDLFDLAHHHGLTTSLDTQYDPANRWLGLDNVLPRVDYFFPNRSELGKIAGLEDPLAAAARLAPRVGTLAVKLGGQGALAIHQGRWVQAHAPAMPVVDTVGAGDSFDAGFVYGVLQGWPLEQSLRLGVACGSLSTRQAGGTAAQPALDEALALAETLTVTCQEG
jgi:sugar/nucleoside kinase (ribokinase family)